jgi:serine protease DegQ
MTQLIEKGHIVRGWIGAVLGEISDEVRQHFGFKEQNGVYVQNIFNHGPAKRAGITPGDIIVKINDIAIKNSTAAVQLVTSLEPGKAYPIEIFRKGHYITFSVVIGTRPKEK